MGEYKPPFTITNEILSYVSSISEKIGQITAVNNLQTKPHHSVLFRTADVVLYDWILHIFGFCCL